MSRRGSLDCDRRLFVAVKHPPAHFKATRSSVRQPGHPVCFDTRLVLGSETTTTGIRFSPSDGFIAPCFLHGTPHQTFVPPAIPSPISFLGSGEAGIDCQRNLFQVVEANFISLVKGRTLNNVKRNLLFEK